MYCYYIKLKVVMNTFLNASEVAKILKVDRSSVTRWIKKGLIDGAVSPSDGHQWRIPLASVEKLRKERVKYESR